MARLSGSGAPVAPKRSAPGLAEPRYPRSTHSRPLAEQTDKAKVALEKAGVLAEWSRRASALVRGQRKTGQLRFSESRWYIVGGMASSSVLRTTPPAAG